MNSYRIVANYGYMQASVFLSELKHFKQLKSVFLNIYNSASKVAFLKSSHIIIALQLPLAISLGLMYTIGALS